MNAGRLLTLVAVVLFLLAALLVLFDAGEKDLPEVLALFGLGAFAAGHVT